MRRPAVGGDLTATDITRVLDTAAHLAKVTDRAIKKVPTLRGRPSQPVLRGLDPDPDLLQLRQAPLGRRDQLLGQGLECSRARA